MSEQEEYMENTRQLTKKQKKETYRLKRDAQKIMGLMEEAFQANSNHSFSRNGLLQDRKADYWPDDYETLRRINDEKAQRVVEAVSQDGAAATANVMRNCCQVIADPERTQEEGTKALLDAVHLLVILAKLGKRDTEQINRAIIDDRARDIDLKSLDDVMYRQWESRNIFYTPELRAKMLKDLKVRTIG